jgi:hypothetical protein
MTVQELADQTNKIIVADDCGKVWGSFTNTLLGEQKAQKQFTLLENSNKTVDIWYPKKENTSND